MQTIITSSQSAGSGNSPDPGSFTGDNGYYIFPNGLIMQWGFIGAFGDDQIRTFRFPTPFKNKCFSLVLTTQSWNTAGGTTGSPFVASITKTTFQVNTDPQAWHGGSGYRWIAIGY